MGINLLHRVTGAVGHVGVLVLLARVLSDLLLLVRLVSHHHARLRLRGVLSIRRGSRRLLSHGTLRHRSIVASLRGGGVVRLGHLLLVDRLLSVLAVHGSLIVSGR